MSRTLCSFPGGMSKISSQDGCQRVPRFAPACLLWFALLSLLARLVL